MLLVSGAPASETITLGIGALDAASRTRPTIRPFEGGAGRPDVAGVCAPSTETSTEPMSPTNATERSVDRMTATILLLIVGVARVLRAAKDSGR
jgi:hypothetical protein